MGEMVVMRNSEVNKIRGLVDCGALWFIGAFASHAKGHRFDPCRVHH